MPRLRLTAFAFALTTLIFLAFTLLAWVVVTATEFLPGTASDTSPRSTLSPAFTTLVALNVTVEFVVLLLAAIFIGECKPDPDAVPPPLLPREEEDVASA